MTNATQKTIKEQKMSEYIVLCLSPLSKNRVAQMWNCRGLEDAEKMGLNKRKNGYDVLIIKKEVVYNDWAKKEEETYSVEKFGYYKVYNFINKIILIFVFILLSLFIYLYYKFVNK